MSDGLWTAIATVVVAILGFLGARFAGRRNDAAAAQGTDMVQVVMKQGRDLAAVQRELTRQARISGHLQGENAALRHDVGDLQAENIDLHTNLEALRDESRLYRMGAKERIRQLEAYIESGGPPPPPPYPGEWRP